MIPAAGQNFSPSAAVPRTGLAPLARINLGLLAAMAAALTALLWPQWRHNPDMSHGIFMPLVFLLLLRESRAGGPRRFLSAGGAAAAAVAMLLAGGLLALAAGGLYAAALDWSHALVGFALTGALTLLLAAGLLVFAGAPVRFVPFNWASVTAVGLWLLCAPIPPGTYTRFTLELQLGVTRGVIAALHLLGVAAVRNGNIIELARTTVGVEEACSGVRSLLSCVFAGFFFSAALVRRPWARLLVIALAAPLALITNFIRSLTLTLLADRGVRIAGAWHDLTGYSILGLTSLLLAGIAFLLMRGEREKCAPAPASAPPAGPAGGRRGFLQPLLAAGLALAAALVVFFILHARPAVRPAAAPDLARMVPAQADGWEVRSSDDLERFADTLETDHLVQRTYFKPAPDGGLLQVTVYIAYWSAGQASVSLVASHTPDACWPGAGWIAEPSDKTRAHVTVAGRALPEPEFRLFSKDSFPQRVWFWHLYAGRPLPYRDPYSPRELLRLALLYGFGRQGPQFFVRVSSNRPWAAFANEPLMKQIFTQLQPYGL